MVKRLSSKCLMAFRSRDKDANGDKDDAVIRKACQPCLVWMKGCNTSVVIRMHLRRDLPSRPKSPTGMVFALNDLSKLSGISPQWYAVRLRSRSRLFLVSHSVQILTNEYYKLT
jgi:hypothetical protein